MPVVLVTGICGNILSLVVFIRSRGRGDAPVQYLGCLALSDNGVILTIGFQHWLNKGLAYVTGGKHSYNLAESSDISCKVIMTIFNISGIMSAWLIVAFSTERAIIVWFPLKRALISKKKRSAVITMILLTAVCASIYRFIQIKNYQVSGAARCWYPGDLYVAFIMFHIESIMFTYLPCMLILLANLFILFGVSRARSAISGKVKGQGQEKRIVGTLVSVSVFYIIFMFPASVLYSYFLYIMMFPGEESYAAWMYNIMSFFDQFSMFNYCLNFIIYGCTLPFFRREAEVIFRLRKNITPPRC